MRIINNKLLLILRLLIHISFFWGELLDCAIRELYEETGQSVTDLQFKGLLKVKNVSTGNVKYNPVYFSTIEALQPFQKNGEVAEIKLWDLKERLGYIDEVDMKVFDYIG